MKISSTVLILTATLTLCGCPFPSSTVTQKLQKEMTKTEVAQILGNPPRSSTKGESESWYYCFADTKMARFIGYCSTYVVEFVDEKLLGWGRQKEYELKK